MTKILNSVLIWFSVSSLCYSLTVTGYDDGDDDIAKYEEFAEDFARENSEIDCYFKAKLTNCKAGKVLTTFLVNDEEDDDETKVGSVTVDSATLKAVCLPAKCTSGLVVSRKLSIAGEGEEVDPDFLEKGVKGLYGSKEDCKRKASVVISVRCEKIDTSDNAGKQRVMELEMMQMQQEANDKSSINDDGDTRDAFKMTQDGDEENPNGNDGQTMMQQDNHDDIPAGGQSVDIDSLDVNIQEGTTAKIQFNGWFRGNMYANCGNRRGIYWARSGHSSHYKDRIWNFHCKTVADYNFNHCYWTGWLNNFDGPLVANCNTNYIMTGINSYFHGHYHDRRFRLLCCRSPRHYARHCSITGFVNGFRGWMNYAIGGRRVFTGLYSFHRNCYEDRRWGFIHCRYSR